MNSLCRLCLSKLAPNFRLSIFKDPCLTLNCSQMIFICTDIEVKEGDGLPDEICQSCSLALNQCYQFRNQCRDTDKLLRKTSLKKILRSTLSQEHTLEDSITKIRALKNLVISAAKDRFAEIGSPQFSCKENSLFLSTTNQTTEYGVKGELGDTSLRSRKEQMHDADVDTESLSSQAIQMTICKERKEPENRIVSKPQTRNESRMTKVKLKSDEKNADIEKKDSMKRKSFRSVDKPASFTCKFCNKQYPSEGGWRYHVHTVHSKSYQPFICDLCGKSFKVKKNLEVHKNAVHFGIKQNLCDLCGRGFATKYALTVHKTWHTGERNYKCDVCDAKFPSRGKLNTHRAIHGGPKKFMCDVCSRDFRWKKDFQIHMRMHTGEKPYSCSICAKAFSSFTNKKKHEKSHIGGPSRQVNTLVSDLQLSEPLFKTDLEHFPTSYNNN